MHRICFIFALCLCIVATSALAGEYPRIYPWQGVSISSFTQNKFTPDELRKLKGILPALNLVQLRLNPKKSAQREKLTIEQAMHQSYAWADSILDECAELNIAGLISYEGFPLDLEVDYDHTSPKFWGNSNHIKEVIDTATMLGRRFSERGSEFVGYQIISEPVVLMLGKAWKPPHWQLILRKMVKAIRSSDPDRWIVVAPGPWGGAKGYRDFKPLGKKIIYGAHMYFPHAYTHQGLKKWHKSSSYPNKGLDKESLQAALQPLRDFQLRYDVPIYIGEFSAIRWAVGSEDYLKDLVAIFNEYKWSWVYFSVNGWHGWNPNYSNKKYSDWRKLWKEQYVGGESDRWKTLQDIF